VAYENSKNLSAEHQYQAEPDERKREAEEGQQHDQPEQA
jgi:hypothetical protein